VRRTGTNYYFDYSFDGYGWNTANAGAALALGFVCGHMGLGVNNNATAVTQTAYFQFFRFIGSDVGLGGMSLGARG
jgi:hypothetical protein